MNEKFLKLMNILNIYMNKIYEENYFSNLRFFNKIKYLKKKLL
jgi:hypothetical protein